MDIIIKEFFSQNQQIVFDLIIEFRDNKDNMIIDEEYRKNYFKILLEYFKRTSNIANNGMKTLSYFFLLRKIASKYILVKNFSEEILISQILKDYCRKIYSEVDFFVYNIPYEKHKVSGYCVGIQDFIEYKNTLIIERDVFGNKN